ncbi:MAG TPA: nickel-dependent lactate racemase, partial [Anaerolineaceae bacterium]|nr:nickel-dependent lactate racemase [Anaerolineaceae bacterium]
MQIKLPYGRSTMEISIPDKFQVEFIEAPNPAPAPDPHKAVWQALDSLRGGLNWEDFRNSKSVAIAINDKTRPVPHAILLPPLLERLAALGIPASAITFYIAVGSHPPMRKEEFPAILPNSILERYAVVSHDSEDPAMVAFAGSTSRGTPVWVNRRYLESDLKIVVGNIEPHQFAGFSGGVKTAAIGLAGLRTINKNHALMTDAQSVLGEYATNPTRQDIEEIGEKINIHLALNAILNQQREIICVLAGAPRTVVREGLAHSRQACQVAVGRPFRMVIASPGGHPKDINVYQTQKGLAHAALVTQAGGTLFLVAACPEGTGSPHYENWVDGKTNHQEVINSFFEEGFRIGPHKAYQISRDALPITLYSYTQMELEFARRLLLNPVTD